MKVKFGILLFCLSLLMIVLSSIKINLAYNTKPTICYDGQKKEFKYFNIKEKDMFVDLKNLMPGDKKEQEIIIKAVNIKKNTKLYLNINKENYKNILQFITIYVENKEIAKDKEYIKLTEFSNYGEIKLNVIVNVPIEAGNEIDDLTFNMDWNILVQEEDDKIIDVPNTYDDSNIVLYIIICAISFIILIFSSRKIAKELTAKKE